MSVLFCAHRQQIKRAHTLAKIVSVKFGRKVYIAKFSEGQVDSSEVGYLNGKFNMLPESNRVEKIDGGSKDITKILRRIENRIGKNFVRESIVKDRFFCNFRDNQVKHHEYKNKWNESKVYSFLLLFFKKFTQILDEVDPNLVFVEAERSTYKMIRALCRERSTTTVQPGHARLWDRIYLEYNDGFDWNECVLKYNKFLTKGIPKELRLECQKRMIKIKKSKSEPSYQSYQRNKNKVKYIKNIIRPYKLVDKLRQIYNSQSLHKSGNPYLKRREDVKISSLIKRYIRRKLSTNYLNSSALNKVSFDTDYAVYFLHVQPEITVEEMSFPFSDQIHTLKQIYSCLPADMPLLVKEHSPMVGKRSREFYAELDQIPGIYLVSHKVSQHNLIKNAEIVLTLTGTVALESVLYGTPSLLFGDVFFENFRGIYRVECYNELKSTISEPHLLRGSTKREALCALASTYVSSFEGQWPAGEFGDINQAIPLAKALVEVSER
jgi:hypothetical protein